MTPTPPDLVDLVLAVAVHEAGHALVATELGIRARTVKVWRHRDGGAQGFTEIEDDAVKRPREYSMILIAGITAEAMWLREVHGYRKGHAGAWAARIGCSDLREFRSFAPPHGITLDAARRDVFTVLRPNMGRVVRGADLLYQRRAVNARAL